jgi:hypothetical protein
MNILTTFITATLILFAFYVLTMRIKRWLEHTTKGETRLIEILCAPIVITAVILDAFYNISWATLFFVDFPHEWMLTARLKRYIAGPDNWRRKVALWVCHYLLNPYDPSGHHC